MTRDASGGGGNFLKHPDLISDRKCEDRPRSPITLLVAQASFEFIRHSGDDALAETAASFAFNLIDKPNPIVLDRQLDLGSMSAGA